MTEPQVSVVMATFGRGRHILPSIRSVLGQSLKDWELLVVGDACTDETEAVVGALDDPRVRWLNLAERVGSQSGPNNAGIAAARAGVVAYLGHDDIWEPDHLERLVEVYNAGAVDFVLSGCLLHPPLGIDLVEVKGILTEDTDLRQHFFPPSGFSHLRNVVDRIGGWRKPEEISRAVDDDLLHRAIEAGMRFRSTGVVTVHKFTAAQRYLSYLCLSSDEQEGILAEMGQPAHAARMATLIEKARAAGRFMQPATKDYAAGPAGEFHRQSIARRGARAVPLVPLGQGTVIRHRVEPSNLDWKARPVLGFRVNRHNPRPRLLVPVVGGRALLRFLAGSRTLQTLGPVALLCNGEQMVARPGRRWFGLVAWFARYEVEITLRPDGPTVLEFQLAEAQRPMLKQRRLAVGPLHLSPL
jgi:hypothetical protein